MCPKCAGQMRVIAFIEQAEVIRKILEHLGLWGTKRPVRPRSHAPPAACYNDGADFRMPSADDYLTDPVYAAVAYL
ncbi:MAG: hypothetical protein V2I40_02515 [Desulfobacteraceae bacterium]|nr:hypothetical protein [Desulfobacteraceae bacterium]